MYRKFKADQIFDGKLIRPAETVLICSEEGVVLDLVDESDAGDDVEVYNGIISPGFVNAHCHLELSHLKGKIPPLSGVVNFVFDIVRQRDRDKEEILPAIASGEEEMLRGGIVAVGDVSNKSFSIAQKTFNNLWYRNFIEISGFPPPIAGERFEKGMDVYKAFNIVLPNNSLVAHAPYSVSRELLKMINELPGNEYLTIHNQESDAENELFEKGSGELTTLYQNLNIDISFFKPPCVSSLQAYLPLLNKFRSLLLVHNLCISEKDIQTVRTVTKAGNRSCYYCLCPNANLYISGTLPDVSMLVREACEIVIGTDSLASNHHLSILEELKTLHRNFPEISISSLLQWATMNGARALGCDDLFGSFEKQKKPGIVLIGGGAESTFDEFQAGRLL